MRIPGTCTSTGCRIRGCVSSARACRAFAAGSSWWRSTAWIDRPVRRRLQDPGADDADSAGPRYRCGVCEVEGCRGAGRDHGWGAAAMSTANKTRAVIVQDPDGHFVELAQLDPLPATDGTRLEQRDRHPPARHGRGHSTARCGSTASVSTCNGETRAVHVQPARVAHAGTAATTSTGMANVADAELAAAARVLELKGPAPAIVRSRVQDPGSFRLQLNVRDIDAALAGLRRPAARRLEQSRPRVDDLRLAAVATGRRRRSQQPVPDACSSPRASAAARRSRRRPAGRGGRTRRGPPGLSASTASRATTPARGRRDLALDALDLVDAPANAAVWEKVIKKVRSGAMPPQGMPQPDAPARAALVAFLETTLDRAAAARPNPGRPALHRLNRDRIPERHPRSAGARRRCRVAAAGRRLELRLRQRGRRAGRVAGAARALHRGRREDQRDGGGRSRRRRRPTRLTACVST